MKCGAKCFLVELELDGKVQTIPVNARTPVAVRKTIRREYGSEPNIISVRAQDKRE